MSEEEVNVVTDSAKDAVKVAFAAVAAPATSTEQETGDGKPVPQDGCTYTVDVGGTVYTVSHTPAQLEAIRAIIMPKPTVDDTNAAQVTADHIQSVRNVGDLIISLVAEAIDDHDSRKLKQSTEEHHKEWHHWPLDGGPDALKTGFLPLQYALEAWCDYFATVYGRFFAGRGIDWLKPTSQQKEADSLNATNLYFLRRFDLATVTPPIPGGEEDA